MAIVAWQEGTVEQAGYDEGRVRELDMTVIVSSSPDEGGCGEKTYEIKVTNMKTYVVADKIKIRNVRGYTQIHSKKSVTKLIKLSDWRKRTSDYRVMGSEWVLCLQFAHTRPIYPTYFAGNPYTTRIMAKSIRI